MAPSFHPRDRQLSVAFVCLGNICRSPMAEAVFRHKVKELGYSYYFKTIDSFGTTRWHTGESPDARTVQTCRKNGVPIEHQAQEISLKDFDRFDYILAMDETNLRDLRQMQPIYSDSIVELFGKWRSNSQFNKVVGDPYYGGISGFEYNFQQLGHFSEEFLLREVGTLD
ncbi:stp1 [Candida oxycetoniae]|uniref:Stp1 n=1 Tax=Candida oxycetoniae TaxID=497107 RepID=A0AAI9WWF7_9ASCO|nr:stp1 [Candida oxycetoniae]KAI3402694.1 stp1 [Candida oxycetoniae]